MKRQSYSFSCWEYSNAKRELDSTTKQSIDAAHRAGWAGGGNCIGMRSRCRRRGCFRCRGGSQSIFGVGAAGARALVAVGEVIGQSAEQQSGADADGGALEAMVMIVVANDA